MKPMDSYLVFKVLVQVSLSDCSPLRVRGLDNQLSGTFSFGRKGRDIFHLPSARVIATTRRHYVMIRYAISLVLDRSNNTQR